MNEAKRTSSNPEKERQPSPPENYETPKLKPLGKWQPRTLFAYWNAPF